LGNQLFCYAAARRLSLKNNAELVIDDVTGFKRDYQYRRKYALDKFHIKARKATADERKEPFARYRRAMAKFVARHQTFYNRRYIEQQGLEYDSRLLDIKISGIVYVDGYWQSENYFKDAEDVIRQELRIISPQDIDNQETARIIMGCDAICVHVRLFDKHANQAGGSENNITRDYYSRAVQKIKNTVPSPHFFVFSDDPDAARKMLALPECKLTYVDHNRSPEEAYADLWIMTQCKHFIIANSTFSWWGAWLANNKDKIVIAPDVKWTGIASWGFKGLIPEDWLLL
jgi:hypothetical protein